MKKSRPVMKIGEGTLTCYKPKTKKNRPTMKSGEGMLTCYKPKKK